MAALLTDLLSTLNNFTVLVEIDFVVTGLISRIHLLGSAYPLFQRPFPCPENRMRSEIIGDDDGIYPGLHFPNRQGSSRNPITVSDIFLERSFFKKGSLSSGLR